jgi:raffinose/stachyose/melibiose transport system substrate-binding protein
MKHGTMMSLTRTLMVGLLFLAIALPVVAGGQGEADGQPEEVTLTFFSAHPIQEPGIQDLIAAYEGENPHVDVVATFNGTDYVTQLRSMVASDTVPDLPYTSKQNLSVLVEQEVFRDLSDRPVADIIFDVARDAMSVGDAFYGAPLSLQGYGMIYNPDFMEQIGVDELPDTLSELRSVVDGVKELGVVPFTSHLGQTWATGQYLLFGISPILARDTSVIEDINNGDATLADERFHPIFDLLEIVKANLPPNPLNYDFTTGSAYFGQENAAMALHGTWLLQAAAPVNEDIRFALGPMPISEDPDDAKIVVGVNEGVGINPNSAHLEETIRFFDFLTKIESIQSMRPHTKSLAPYEGFDTSELDPVFTQMQELIVAGASVGWEWTKLNPAVVKEADLSMQAYMIGDITRDEVLEAAQNAIDLAR